MHFLTWSLALCAAWLAAGFAHAAPAPESMESVFAELKANCKAFMPAPACLRRYALRLARAPVPARKDGDPAGLFLFYAQSLHFDGGYLTEAEALYKRTLDLLRLNSSRSAGDEAFIESDLAVLYLHQGRVREARALLVEALAGFEKARTPDPEWYPAAMVELGDAYAALGSFRQAEGAYGRARAIREAWAAEVRRARQSGGLRPEMWEGPPVGPPRFDTGIDVRLAALYRQQGKFDQALQLLQPSLADSPVIQSLDQAYRVIETAAIRIAQHEDAQAGPLLERVLAFYESAPRKGEAVPWFERIRMLDAMDQLTALYRRDGRTPRAEALAQRAAALHRDEDAKK